MSLVRVGDIAIGTCRAHRRTRSVIVTWVTGSPTVRTNGIPTVTSVGVGISSCGHTATVIGSSATIFSESTGVHGVGESCVLPGGVPTTVTGSPNVSGRG
jgi:hypothetical protein